NRWMVQIQPTKGGSVELVPEYHRWIPVDCSVPTCKGRNPNNGGSIGSYSRPRRRQGLARPRFWSQQPGRRRSRIQYLDDRIPGDPDGSFLLRADCHDDLSSDWQLWSEQSGYRITPRLRRRFRCKGAIPYCLELAR